jgi:hypothetical protein
MIETRPCGQSREPTHLTRVAPPQALQTRYPLLRAVLWWAPPATAMLAGSWTTAMVLAAAGQTFDVVTTITCTVAVAVAVAVFGGMCLFEQLVGAPGAALGIGFTLQLIHAPLVENGVIPGWSTSVGWILTAVAAGALAWQAHTRRPPLIRTAAPLVTDRAALAGADEPDEPDEPAPTGRWCGAGRHLRSVGLSGWPRTALQAVELSGNLPVELDAVASVETRWSQVQRFSSSIRASSPPQRRQSGLKVVSMSPMRQRPQSTVWHAVHCMPTSGPMMCTSACAGGVRYTGR